MMSKPLKFNKEVQGQGLAQVREQTMMRASIHIKSRTLTRKEAGYNLSLKTLSELMPLIRPRPFLPHQLLKLETLVKPSSLNLYVRSLNPSQPKTNLC